MKTIKYKNGQLRLPVLVAGSTMSVQAYDFPENSDATLYVIFVDAETNTPCAISEELNKENAFTANINLMTDIVFHFFAGKHIDMRRRMSAEVIDTHNRHALANGFSVMRNSLLLTGPSVTLPTFGTVITSDLFDGISAARPATPTQVYDLLAEILSILKP